MIHPTRLRKIERLPAVNIKRSVVSANKPDFRWVDPKELYVEPTYQRDLSRASITLIHKIVENWDWAHVKPIICGEHDERLYVIDGQHTAIAAVTHGGIKKVPALVFTGLSLKDRAVAFLGHNRNRLNITHLQMFYAALAAGDEVAVALREAADKAGATVLKYPPASGIFKVGDIMCVTAAQAVAKAKGVNGAARAFKILVKAKRAPIGAKELKAVAKLLWGDMLKGPVDDEALAVVIRSRTIKEWEHRAEILRAKSEERLPLDQGLAKLWARELVK